MSSMCTITWRRMAIQSRYQPGRSLGRSPFPLQRPSRYRDKRPSRTTRPGETITATPVAYLVNDAVKSGDTFYRCIAPTTGHPPPNAIYWTLLANDQTILVDNIANRNYARLITVQTFNNKPLARVTGITFKGGLTAGYNAPIGFYTLDAGPIYNVRLDHCHFDGVGNLQNTTWGGHLSGVADHCIIDNTPPQNMQNSVNNGGQDYGDLSFTQPANYGSAGLHVFRKLVGEQLAQRPYQRIRRMGRSLWSAIRRQILAPV